MPSPSNVVAISQLPDGGVLQATDMIHVARGNFSGSDFKVILGTPITPPSGGGGYSQQKIVASGSSDSTAFTGIFIGWNSSSGSPKTQTIPASTGSLEIITISDLLGDAYTNPITAVPASGSIIGAQNSIYTNYGSITLLDTSAGWVSI